MDVITLEREQAAGEKLSSFENMLKEAGRPIPEGEVLTALAGTEPLAEGSAQICRRAPHRAQLFLAYLSDTPEEVLENLTGALVQRLAGTEVTLVLAAVPEGEGNLARALEACGFLKEGTIPGYEKRDDRYLDADFYALDLREEEEEDGDEKQRTYVISMLRDGYDDGNIAYFCGVEEAYVHAVREELGIPEPE